MPSKKTNKYKLLLDEGLPPRESFPEINNYHAVQHINHDVKRGGASDKIVYLQAIKDKSLPVVLNTKDFKPLIKSNSPSVISLSPNLTNKDTDIKIGKCLRGLKPSEKIGHLISISNEGIIITRILK
jgi:hypothetical protein